MKYSIGASIFFYSIFWLLVFSLFPENGFIVQVLTNLKILTKHYFLPANRMEERVRANPSRALIWLLENMVVSAELDAPNIKSN